MDLKRYFAEDERAPAADGSAASPPPGARLLVVDDDPDVLDYLAETLPGYGFEVLTEEDPLAALRRLRDGERVDLVLLDWVMPAPGGAEVLRRLRRLPQAPPVFVMSAHSQKQDILAARDEGAAYYLVKPFHVGRLVLKINAAIGAAAPAGPSAESRPVQFSAHLPLTLLDVSESGCSFDSVFPLPEDGIVFIDLASLAERMDIPRRDCFPVRVANCSRRGRRYRVGCTFVAAPGPMLKKLQAFAKQPQLTAGGARRGPSGRHQARPPVDRQLLEEEKTPRLLVVAGRPDRRRELAGLFAGDAVEVTAAGSGAEALAALRGESPPRLLLIDEELPDGSGLDLLARLPEGAPRAVVLLASERQEDVLAALRQGAVDALLPSASADHLRHKVKSLLRAHSTRRRREPRYPCAQETAILFLLTGVGPRAMEVGSSFPLPEGTTLLLECDDLAEALDVDRDQRLPLRVTECAGGENRYRLACEVLTLPAAVTQKLSAFARKTDA